MDEVVKGKEHRFQRCDFVPGVQPVKVYVIRPKPPQSPFQRAVNVLPPVAPSIGTARLRASATREEKPGGKVYSG